MFSPRSSFALAAPS